ncbi:hypothetical protein D3C86_1963010 [compost metagenome]
MQISFIAVLAYNPLKAVNADTGFLYFYQFLYRTLAFTESLQHPFVYAFGQQVIIRKLVEEFVVAYLLMSAERHTPWREAEEYSAFRFQEHFQVLHKCCLIWNVLNYIP